MNRIRKVGPLSKHKNREGVMVPSPSIGLSGKALANLGFSQGDRVHIWGTEGLIIVRKCPDRGDFSEGELIASLEECLLGTTRGNPHFEEGVVAGIKISNLARRIMRL